MTYQCDTPEDLLDSGRERDSGVLGFRSSKTNKFSPSEGKGSRDKDRAQPLKSSAERSGVIPIMSSKIALRTAWNSTSSNDNSENNKANDLIN
jgi:hypothetical protein